MTDTANLGLPFIEGSQAQKHVTHNEALRILDAAIQVAVLDTTRTAPPLAPAEGDRHIVAASPTGAWNGHAATIATWEDGAWRFLVPGTGWIAWSVEDDILFVFDGSAWRDLRDIPAMFDHIGVNTSATTTNRLSVRSNAVLLTDVATGDGGSGDIRLQLSKQSAGKTASVVFSNAFSGRAEFGLVGSDAFQLKVSPDGTSFSDAFTIDQMTANLTLPRALSLTGAISPPQITANQNDYAPSGLSTASTLRLSTDASRNLTGIAAGADGRTIIIHNVGAQSLVLKNDVTSTAANRLVLGADTTLTADTSITLRYDGTSSRWRAMTSPGSGSGGGSVSTTYPLNGTTALTFTGQIGQGRLDYSSATSIRFNPFNGDLIRVNGGLFQIPSGGINSGNPSGGVFLNGTGSSSLSSNTVYYVYVFNNSGTLALDFSATAYAVDTAAGNIGTYIKSGTATRSLVGLIRTNSSAQFANSATQRLVRSWFNARPAALENNFTATRTTTAAYPVEVNTEIRVEFVCWANDVIQAQISGVLDNSGSNYSYLALGWDGTADTNRSVGSFGTNTVAGGVGQAKSLSEGYHYLTLIGGAGANTATYYGASSSRNTILAASVQPGY